MTAAADFTVGGEALRLDERIDTEDTENTESTAVNLSELCVSVFSVLKCLN